MPVDGGIDPDDLGRATWTFLHTLAAAQPERLGTVRQQRLRHFMTYFSELYPCAPCAESFRAILRARPVQTDSGPQFALWLCAVHNDVNRELGKKEFDCAKVGDRWGVCEACARHSDELNQFKTTVMRHFAASTTATNKE